MTEPAQEKLDIAMPQGFSLERTCAPAFWITGRWPNEDWREGAFWWVGWENGRVVWRRASSIPGGVRVSGSGDPARFADWAMRVLRPRIPDHGWTDPVIAALDRLHPGMGLLNSGDLVDGAVTSVVGQSISLASAGAALTRLAAGFNAPIRLAGREFRALPNARQLSESRPEDLRQTGVTQVRAEALVAVGAWFREHEASGTAEPDVAAMSEIRGIGPWTIASTLLWGAGDPAVYPRGDAALLRAAKRAYGRPDLSHAELDAFARGWDDRPAVAARLLWLDLFGHPA